MSSSSSEPKPCTNNCEFFGSAEYNHLCSKCYRDLLKTDLENSLSFLIETFTSTVDAAEQPSSSDTVVPSKPEKKRCNCCNKKVGLTGFVCKCGNTFCGLHRYPEKHDCSYDFKTAGRHAISEANPVVKSDKIQRF